MSDLRTWISSLTPAQRTLFQLRLQKKSAPSPKLQAIPRRQGTGPCPLTFEQERIWLFQEIFPEGAAYNISNEYRYSGRLDIPALLRSLLEIVRRHEVLRTSFIAVDGKPWQVVGPPPEVPDLPIVDLSGLPASRRKGELRGRLGDRSRQPFDLAGKPLRVTLFQLAEAESLLFATIHHIATDWWSFTIFYDELASLYRQISQGRAPSLPELPIQFADFALWQREWLRGDVLDRLLAYWRDQLDGAPPLLEFPTDRPRPEATRFAGARQLLSIGPETMDRLRSLGQRHEVTPFVTFLSAYAALLFRGSRTDDFLIGTPVADRGRPETEHLIGYFLNLLVLRIGVSGEITFQQFMKRVREIVYGAYSHQDMPFGKLLDDLRPARTLNHMPLAQLSYLYVMTPGAGSSAPSAKAAEEMPFDPGTSRFDLTLVVEDRPGGVHSFLEYSLDLFDATTVLHMARRLRSLLEQVAADPDVRICDLAFLSESERAALLYEWNDTAVLLPGPECLHRLVEEQVGRTPDRVALVCGDVRIGYAELWRRVELVAAELHRRGVGPEVRVGLCLERSAEMVAGVLGTLAAGGVYVPLDPDLPGERLAWMARDAGAAVVLTTESLRESLPEMPVPVVCLDRLPSSSGSSSSPVAGDHLAYVLYTSGTSGRPKGVMVSHRAIRNRLLWMLEAFPFAERDAVLQKTPFGFDASIWELFVPLLCGARVVLARPGGHRDPEHLVEVIAREEVTHLQLVPSQLGALLDEPGLGACSSLRRLFCGGEALPRRMVERFLSVLPGVEVVNLYGPTEAAIDAAFHRCSEGLDGPIVSLGRPIGNAEVWVVDAGMEPLPRGWVGELAIGGAGLARGYSGQAGLTAEKFVPHPLASRPGERLYRTGDWARWSQDGRLEFLGRLDEQIKVRGVRVEPAEVEAALATHPQVSESAVMAREDVPGQARLVAYVVARGERAPTASELRAHLERTLPEAMIPSAYVSLPALPLGPHGKLDRKLLPAVDEARPELDTTLRPPRTATEQALVEIWREVLGLEQVGVRDDFFDLGGHSLLAIQVMARVRAAFVIDVRLRQLFRFPTIEALAGVVERAIAAGSHVETPPIERVARDSELPLSFAQQRLWFLHQIAPKSAMFNVAMPVRLTGPLDVDALARSLTEIVRRHETLRTAFPAQGGQPVQRIGAPYTVDMPVTDLRPLPAEEREREMRERITASAAMPFDLEHGPLFRAELLCLDNQEHVGLLCMHHVVSDDWSTGVLVRELAALYDAFTTGLPSPLPELPIQYADFAAWQRRCLSGEQLNRQLAYWTERLQGAPPLLELRADRQRPEAKSTRGRVMVRVLADGLADRLEALAHQEGCTLFMVLLSGFDLLMGQQAGTEDLVVGTDVACRDRLETEGLIGFFVNQLALRFDLSGDPSFRELLGRVREVTLGGYAHQDLPFERLVQAIRPERSLAYTPLFQVKLNLQNLPASQPHLAGITMSSVGLRRTVVELDLIVKGIRTVGGLSVSVEYSTDLFEPSRVSHLLEGFELVLETVVSRPEVRFSEISAHLAEADARFAAVRAAELAATRREMFQSVRRTPQAGAQSG